MGTMTIGVESKVEKKFRQTVRKEFGEGKGKLGKAVTQAMKYWIDSVEQKRIAEEEIKILDNGFNMGKIIFKKREELYGR